MQQIYRFWKVNNGLRRWRILNYNFELHIFSWKLEISLDFLMIKDREGWALEPEDKENGVEILIANF